MAKTKKYAFGGMTNTGTMPTNPVGTNTMASTPPTPSAPMQGMDIQPPMGRPSAPPGLAVSAAARGMNRPGMNANPSMNRPMAPPGRAISEAARNTPQPPQVLPPAFKKGGTVPALFKGKESKKEEMAEATAVKNGKISPKQYAAGEKKEGHGKNAMAKGMAIKSGKMSPFQYASGEKNEQRPKRYAKGGSVCRGGGAAMRGTKFSGG